jgi:hypothetical protein
MQRTPPAHIRRKLQKEANYGCPVCGSPFLTWHHFDPSWAEHAHHNPEGMIALCPGHAKMADAGVYTKDQLKHYKTNPFIRDKISASWPWEPENVVFLMGGCIFFGVRPLLTLQQKEVFSATRVLIPGTTTKSIVFDLDLVDPRGSPIVTMEKNWLTVHTDDLSDLRFTPGSKEFVVLHTSGLKLGIYFDRYSSHDFQRHLLYVTNDNKEIAQFATEFAIAHSIDSDGLIPVITLMGRLFNNDVTMKIEKKAIKLECKFFQGEKVRIAQKCFLGSGSLSFNLEGHGEIMKFG